MRSLPLANQPVIGDPSIRRAIRWIVRQSLFAIYVLSWGLTAAAACYGATIIFSFAAGYASPPAALFALLPAAHRFRTSSRLMSVFPARTAAYQSSGPLGDRFRREF